MRARLPALARQVLDVVPGRRDQVAVARVDLGHADDGQALALHVAAVAQLRPGSTDTPERCLGLSLTTDRV